MRCPRCSTELPTTAKFCLECGLALSAGPGPELASPESYTPRHLAEQILVSRAALEGERKQVTVLFCDLANSTPLAERLGPEGMHAFLNRFFDLALAEIHRYEGTLNQFLGDGFMALFGAPLAHEDDARRAVMAALAIRRALRDRASWIGAGDIAVRIGLNTGPVVIGRIGDNLRMDYTAIGDTTNVAARLQQIADPGAILISEATARLVRGDVRLDPLGALTVKGKSDPVVAYRVRGTARRRSLLEQARERGWASFVGRDREQERLAELASALAAGHGHVVSVVGEAGSGKSRLLYEFRRSLEGGPVTVLEARCRSFGTTTPYLPVVELLRNDFDSRDSDTPEAIAGKARLVVEDLDMDSAATLPYLLRLLGVKEGAEGLEDVPAETIKARTLDALEQMLCRASRRRPLVLLIEDVQWIDAPSDEYVTRLAAALPAAPLLLVTTSRPGFSPRWLDPTRSTEIVLRPLSEDESRGVVESVVQREVLPERVFAMILDKADGNPLFLEELTRAVLEQRDVDAVPAVPETLQAAVTGRIERLPEATKRLLQTAAVLGREFPLRLLDAVWDGPGSALSHLEELSRLEFVHPTEGEEPAYAFNHALSQDVAYESLLLTSRRAQHEAAGRALERLYAARPDAVLDRLAFHFSRAADAEKAITYLSRVAEQAGRAYANTEAVRALDQALAHVDGLVESERARARLELILQKSLALLLLGGVEESRDLLLGERTVVDGLRDPRVTSHYYFRLASACGLLGESHRAIEQAEHALQAATSVDDRGQMGRAHYLLSRENFWVGRLREGVEHGRRAVPMLEAVADRFWLSMAHWAMGLNYVLLGKFERALQAASRTQVLADRLGDGRLACNASWITGWVRALQGDGAAGIAACQRGFEQAPDTVGRALARAFLGIVHIEREEAAAARPLLDESIAAFTRFRFMPLEGWLRILRGLAHFLEGEPELARAMVVRGLEVAGRARFAPAISNGKRVLAAIDRAEGRHDAAEAHVREALDMDETMGARFESARTRLALAELLAVRGDRETAALELRAGLRAFEELGVPAWTGQASRRADALGLPVT